METSALHFLNELESAYTSSETTHFPVPFVMKRISTLIQRMLVRWEDKANETGDRHNTTTSPRLIIDIEGSSEVLSPPFSNTVFHINGVVKADVTKMESTNNCFHFTGVLETIDTASNTTETTGNGESDTTEVAADDFDITKIFIPATTTTITATTTATDTGANTETNVNTASTSISVKQQPWYVTTGKYESASKMYDSNIFADLDDETSTVTLEFLTSLRNKVKRIEGSKDPVFIDVQYSPCTYRSIEGYAIKELSLMCSDSPIAWALVNSPPDAVPSTTHNRDSRIIPWELGIIQVEDLRFLLADLFSQTKRRFYLKGSNKVDVLEQQLNLQRSNTEDLHDFPLLNELCRLYQPSGCYLHNVNRPDIMDNCTTKNASALMSHWRTHCGSKAHENV